MGFAEGLYNNPLPMDRRRSHPSQEYTTNLVITKRGSASALVAWSHDADAGERICETAFELTVSRDLGLVEMTSGLECCRWSATLGEFLYKAERHRSPVYPLFFDSPRSDKSLQLPCAPCRSKVMECPSDM
jgi:hypothetical protein